MRKILNYAEIGIVIGLFLGLALLGIAWYFSNTADANFCLFTIGEKDVCVRYISLYPFVLALLGLLIGFIIDKIKDREEKVELASRVRVSIR